MPELPEVETLRRGLASEIIGRQITAAEVVNAKILKGQPEAEFRERVSGAIIVKIDRRGKYLLFSLDSSQSSHFNPRNSQIPSSVCLCVHLKMRGQLLLEPTDSDPGPYHCVSLRLSETIQGGSNGPGVKEEWSLRFYDMWTWGEMRALTPAECGALRGISQMGPEPLDESWDGAALAKGLGTRKTAIKTALLDQKVLAGVGNIYADESLFRSGIHPERPAAGLTADEVKRLASAIREILTEAVEGGGTRSDEFVDLAGAPGRYRPRVYDRGGQECVTCGSVLTRIRLGGRGTVFCSLCQS